MSRICEYDIGLRRHLLGDAAAVAIGEAIDDQAHAGEDRLELGGARRPEIAHAVFGWSMVTALSDKGLGTLALAYSQLMVVAIIAAVAGVGAAVLPARRAAKLDVLGAIVSE